MKIYRVKLSLSRGHDEVCYAWMENAQFHTLKLHMAKRFTTPTQAKNYVERYWACNYEIVSN